MGISTALCSSREYRWRMLWHHISAFIFFGFSRTQTAKIKRSLYSSRLWLQIARYVARSELEGGKRSTASVPTTAKDYEETTRSNATSTASATTTTIGASASRQQ